jgi:cell division protein FtsQ
LPRSPESQIEQDGSAPFYRPPQEERPRRRSAPSREEPEATTPVESGPFLRGKKRPQVRKSSIRRNARNFLFGGFAVLGLAILVLSGLAVRQYLRHAQRFLITTSDNIETGTLQHLTRAQILDIFGGDIGRNIFYVDLDHRRHQLEELPWIRSATVMRLLPNRLRIEIRERTPVAFVQVGSMTGLIDAAGVVMDLPRQSEPMSYPVITGLNSTDPLSIRAARMKLFAKVMQEIDTESPGASREVSEINLSDPEDVHIVTSAGMAGGTVVVRLGDHDFGRRYRLYLDRIATWRTQYNVRSIDLRYDGQVIVNREGQGQ